jgi:hypothetical protein
MTGSTETIRVVIPLTVQSALPTRFEVLAATWSAVANTAPRNSKTTIRGITMDRSDSVDWFLRLRRFALGASVTLLTAVLTVGCGSSSSSSTDANGGGGTTPPPSGEIDTQDVAVEVASLAFDFEDYADLLLEAEFGADDPSAIVPLSVDAGPDTTRAVGMIPELGCAITVSTDILRLFTLRSCDEIQLPTPFRSHDAGRPPRAAERDGQPC